LYSFSCSFDVNPRHNGDPCGVSNDHLPVGTIPLFATVSSPGYADAVSKFTVEANRIYADFLRSDDGRGFCGQVCLVGDSVGSILAYDALCSANCTIGGGAGNRRSNSDCSLNDINGGGGGGSGDGGEQQQGEKTNVWTDS
jgi:hypothetical protein